MTKRKLNLAIIAIVIAGATAFTGCKKKTTMGAVTMATVNPKMINCVK